MKETMLPINPHELAVLERLFNDLNGMDDNQSILYDRIVLHIELDTVMFLDNEEVETSIEVFEIIEDLNHEENLIFTRLKEYTEL